MTDNELKTKLLFLCDSWDKLAMALNRNKQGDVRAGTVAQLRLQLMDTLSETPADADIGRTVPLSTEDLKSIADVRTNLR